MPRVRHYAAPLIPFHHVTITTPLDAAAAAMPQLPALTLLRLPITLRPPPRHAGVFADVSLDDMPLR